LAIPTTNQTDAVPVEVIVDGHQVKVVAIRSRRVRRSVRLPAPGAGTLPKGTPMNLAPADLKKVAGEFDLPIALGLLQGSGQVSFDRPGSFAIVGKLFLTGETRPVKGVLAMAL
jgi:magnesium chelatase family protein